MRFMNLKGIFSIIIILFYTHSAYPSSRIQTLIYDRGEVNKLFTSYLKASMLFFSDPVEQVFPGTQGLYSFRISKKDPRILVMNMKKQTKTPINVIIKLSNDEIFVFDIVSSLENVYDLTYIEDSYFDGGHNNTYVTKSSKASYPSIKPSLSTIANKQLLYSFAPLQSTKKNKKRTDISEPKKIYSFWTSYLKDELWNYLSWLFYQFF